MTTQPIRALLFDAQAQTITDVGGVFTPADMGKILGCDEVEAVLLEGSNARTVMFCDPNATQRGVPAESLGPLLAKAFAVELEKDSCILVQSFVIVAPGDKQIIKPTAGKALLVSMPEDGKLESLPNFIRADMMRDVTHFGIAVMVKEGVVDKIKDSLGGVPPPGATKH